MVKLQQYLALMAEQGCVLCHQLGLGATPAELHHPTDCGRRLGEWIVIPLCVEHHRGPNGRHGLRRKGFEARYGMTEMDLFNLALERVFRCSN